MSPRRRVRGSRIVFLIIFKICMFWVPLWKSTLSFSQKFYNKILTYISRRWIELRRRSLPPLITGQTERPQPSVHLMTWHSVITCLVYHHQVYTINLESRYLMVQGVPAIGVMPELIQRCALYGAVEEYRPLDEYPAEEFTEVYLVKFQKLTSARFRIRLNPFIIILYWQSGIELFSK